MNSRQAKDFLIGQAAQQAAIEGIPLSELEKRMMYFTEGPDAGEDPVKLSEEFEAAYDTEEYEQKLARLLHKAHTRIGQESPQAARQWGEAMRVLRRGDHYILVLWDTEWPQDRPPGDSWKLLGTAILVILVGSVLLWGYTEIAPRFPYLHQLGTKTHTIMPVWLKRLLFGLLVGGYLLYLAWRVRLRVLRPGSHDVSQENR